jgi:hypothetical protein
VLRRPIETTGFIWAWRNQIQKAQDSRPKQIPVQTDTGVGKAFEEEDATVYVFEILPQPSERPGTQKLDSRIAYWGGQAVHYRPTKQSNRISRT